MKVPWANIILLIILLLQTGTGYLGLLNNQEQFNWVLWAHGIGAYAIVLLLFWKGNIILDALRRKKTWTWQRLVFLLTTFLLLLTLTLGLIWTFNGPHYFLNISYVSWHIYVAVPLMGLMLWHSWKMRFIFRVPQALDRRQFLRTAAFGLAGLLVWRTTNQVKALFDVPGVLRRFTGSYEHGSFSGRFPSVSWIADYPPPVDGATWQLTVAGAVDNPLAFSVEQLQAMPARTETATLDCTGGWYTVQAWQGVRLGDVLAQAGVKETADSVTVRAVSGYQRRFTLAEANRYLLAWGVAGEPLSHGHGFPLRLVASDKRGVEWVKWVSHIEVNTTGKHWQTPLPLR